MILKIIGLADLDFNFKSIYTIEAKSKELFYKLIHEFYFLTNSKYISNQILLFDGDNELSFNKNVYFTTNIFEYNINSKQMLSKIYTLVLESINFNLDLKTKFNNKANEMVNILINCFNEINIDLIWEEEFSVLNFLKAIGLKVDVKESNSIYDKLLSFIDVNSELNLHRLIILPNLKVYFDNKQMEELFKYAIYKGINILCIENIEHIKTIPNETKIIIDEYYDTQIIIG